MSAGAIVAALNSGSGRQCGHYGFLAPKQVNEHHREVTAMHAAVRAKELFRRYDVDKSNNLDRDEIHAMLTDLNWTTPPGTPPQQEEIDFVFRVADVNSKQLISRSDILYAIMAFELYVTGKSCKAENERHMEAFNCYDRDCNGNLDKQELHKYLTKINRYEPVSLQEVEWVLQVADRIGDNTISNHVELLMATVAWQVHAQRSLAAKSKSCSIM